MAPYRIFVRFKLGELDIGLALASVERVVRAVAVTPLPGAPSAILGMVDVHGDVVPVADMRARLGLSPRPLHPDDHLVLARTPRRRLALAVDAAAGVVHCGPGDVIEPASVVPGLEHVHGVARSGEGLLLIHDLDRFLALDEETALQQALERV